MDAGWLRCGKEMQQRITNLKQSRSPTHCQGLSETLALNQRGLPAKNRSTIVCFSARNVDPVVAESVLLSVFKQGWCGSGNLLNICECKGSAKHAQFKRIDFTNCHGKGPFPISSHLILILAEVHRLHAS